jgi:hypothetical protein
MAVGNVFKWVTVRKSDLTREAIQAGVWDQLSAGYSDDTFAVDVTTLVLDSQPVRKKELPRLRMSERHPEPLDDPRG